MRLELKYLAGYLPYGLKFKTNFDHIQYLMTSLDINKSKVTFRAINNFKNSKNISIKLLGENKPILRPLSDLTKEIELNGEKFVPLEEIKEVFLNNPKKGCEHYRDIFKDVYFEWTEECFESNIEMLPYEWIQKILQWHFDIYGLIDAGLAIDINTLNK
jgi:hypothetical protein